MSSTITSTKSPEASGEPNPGIVQNYRTRLQVLGYSPSLIGKCIRTILHLITWLSANGTGIETLDICILHQFLNHDCDCPGPRGYRKNLERARWHLHRFLGFLMETGRVRMPLEIETGSRMVESFLQTLVAQGYVHESIVAYRKRCRHFIVWLCLYDVALDEIDDHVLSRFLSHDCTCVHPHFFIRTGRFAGRNNSRSKIGLFIDYLISTGIAPPRPPPASEESGQYLARFQVWLRRYRGIGDRTIQNYHRAMRVLLPHLGDDPDRYSATLIRNTVRHRLETASRELVRRETSALRLYLRFLVLDGLCRPGLVGAVPTVPRQRFSTLPRHLPREDIEHIIASCDRATSMGMRNRAILLLLARLGLRAGDVANLRLNDIDWDNAVVRVSGKSRPRCGHAAAAGCRRRGQGLYPPCPACRGFREGIPAHDATAPSAFDQRWCVGGRASCDQAVRSQGRGTAGGTCLPAFRGDESAARQYAAGSHQHLAASSIHADNGDLCTGRCPDAPGSGPALAGGRR